MTQTTKTMRESLLADIAHREAIAEKLKGRALYKDALDCVGYAKEALARFEAQCAAEIMKVHKTDKTRVLADYRSPLQKLLRKAA